MLGSLILYLKGTRTTMFQLSGFYYKTLEDRETERETCTSRIMVRSLKDFS